MPPKDARRASAMSAAAISAASKEVPFDIWLGQILAKRQLIELLRSWDKGGDGHLSRTEFKQNIMGFGFQGDQSGEKRTHDRLSLLSLPLCP